MPDWSPPERTSIAAGGPTSGPGPAPLAVTRPRPGTQTRESAWPGERVGDGCEGSSSRARMGPKECNGEPSRLRKIEAARAGPDSRCEYRPEDRQGFRLRPSLGGGTWDASRQRINGQSRPLWAVANTAGQGMREGPTGGVESPVSRYLATAFRRTGRFPGSGIRASRHAKDAKELMRIWKLTGRVLIPMFLVRLYYLVKHRAFVSGRPRWISPRLPTGDRAASFGIHEGQDQGAVRDGPAGAHRQRRPSSEWAHRHDGG